MTQPYTRQVGDCQWCQLVVDFFCVQQSNKQVYAWTVKKRKEKKLSCWVCEWSNDQLRFRCGSIIEETKRTKNKSGLLGMQGGTVCFHYINQHSVLFLLRIFEINKRKL